MKTITNLKSSDVVETPAPPVHGVRATAMGRLCANGYTAHLVLGDFGLRIEAGTDALLIPLDEIMKLAANADANFAPAPPPPPPKPRPASAPPTKPINP